MRPRRWRLVFMPGFVLAMLAANAAAGSLTGPLRPAALARWGLSVDSVGRGEVWRLVSATPLSHDAGMLARQVPFAILAIGIYEWRRGTRRTAAMFWGTDIAATGLSLAVLGAAGAQTRTLDMGMSAGGHGLVGAILGGVARGGWAAGALGAALAVKAVLAPAPLADAVHLAGLGLGVWAERRWRR